MDKRIFAQSMQKLAIVVPAFAPDFSRKEVLAAWHEALSDLDPSKFDSALKTASISSDTFPSVARLRSLAGQGAVSTEAQATTLVGAIVEALKIGPERPTEAYKQMGPEAAAIAMKLGSWRDLCMSTDLTQLEWIRRSWIKTAKAHITDPTFKPLMLPESEVLALPQAQEHIEFEHVSTQSEEKKNEIKTKLREAVK